MCKTAGGFFYVKMHIQSGTCSKIIALQKNFNKKEG